jgi:hypothetical protein
MSFEMSSLLLTIVNGETEMHTTKLLASARRLGLRLAVLHLLVFAAVAQNEPECKDVIDITNSSALGACHLTRGFPHRHEVTWSNKGDSVIYVCFVDESPFDAFMWKVPAQQQGKAGQRKSGDLRSDVPAMDYPFIVSTKKSDCQNPTRGNPHIIIK